jgi:secreted PhoX family phosphatase
MKHCSIHGMAAVLTASMFALSPLAKGQTTAGAQLVGQNGWNMHPLFTVGENINGYTPPGILDGMGSLRTGPNTLKVFVNHELVGTAGYAYVLGNGTALRGARVSAFDLDLTTKQVTSAALAYHTIVDRSGNVVTSGTQINEGTDVFAGADRLCSSSLFGSGTYGLVDDLYFTGEETSNGQLFVLDVANSTLHCAPWLGRAAWENVTMLDAGDPGKVAVLIGDDTQGAPLYLYIGQKNHLGDNSLLDRNGLAYGTLYVWVANSGALSAQDFNGTGNVSEGRFEPIEHYNSALAGTLGYDALGFASQTTQYALASALGAFQFARPEDLSTNPVNGSQAVFTSTGRGSVYPADNWGTTYILDLDIQLLTANVSILYSGDDAGAGQFAGPDFGPRSVDNLDWADNGLIYINEDPSVQVGTFGGASGVEASVWELNPVSGKAVRVAVMHRSAALPVGQTDPNAASFGTWESSGIIDISKEVGDPDTTWLVVDVQAAGVTGGAITAQDLVSGGQLLLMSAAHRSVTAAESMVQGLNDWQAKPIFTIGESVRGYVPTGIFDGIGVQDLGNGLRRAFVNSELGSDRGTLYTLANGLAIKGARIHAFDIDPNGLTVVDAKLAYDRIYDRQGFLASGATQVNEGTSNVNGIGRLCSGGFFAAGTFGLVDDMYIAGEEEDNGMAYVLDVNGRSLHAAPWLGRASFENVAFVESGNPDKVAVVIADDSEGAPLYLYVGDKDFYGNDSFLDRNGLAHGQLYAMKFNNTIITPQEFEGTGNLRNYRFVRIPYHRPFASANTPGYDAFGFATQAKQFELAYAKNCFRFSRPEDVHVNPENGSQIVLVSTGRGSLYPADDWGSTYIVNFDVTNLERVRGSIRVLYDGDDAGAGQFTHPDEGLRSPDNLVWAGDGYIYIQEDRSTSLNTFGGVSGIEASIWKVDAVSGIMERIAVMDRKAKLLPGQTDIDPNDLGDWETSGIVDVSGLFGAPAEEVHLLFDVQAHSVRGGIIDSAPLVEGGQLSLLIGPRQNAEANKSAARSQEQAAIASGAVEMEVFPVPVTDLLNIRMANAGDEPVHFTVFDINGRVAKTFTTTVGAGIVNTDVRALPSGIYLVQAVVGGTTRTVRFQKL